MSSETARISSPSPTHRCALLARRSPLAARTTGKACPSSSTRFLTGLYRLGFTTPASILGIRPDVSVLAKILTGGMVPMSVTLARSSIFDTFSQSDKKVDALLHGHSYTAHPIGCEVANDTLGRIERMRTGESGARSGRTGAPCRARAAVRGRTRRSIGHGASGARRRHLPFRGIPRLRAAWRWAPCWSSTCARAMAKEVRYSSTAGADMLKDLRDTQNGSFEFNIHARPLGNVVYLMSSLNTPVHVRRGAERALEKALSRICPALTLLGRGLFLLFLLDDNLLVRGPSVFLLGKRVEGLGAADDHVADLVGDVALHHNLVHAWFAVDFDTDAPVANRDERLLFKGQHMAQSMRKEPRENGPF
ncbi:hypothetical protein L7F22_036897 [Adiantum nelumboides]|nr:hypothetical protein [Adiantum nelumboides]